MNFALTEDQQLIRDAAARYLSESSGSAAVRAAMETATGYRDEIWQCIAGELGWCALGVAEDCGGLGLGPVEQVLMMEQCGRHLLCAPLLSTVGLAATLLAQAAAETPRRHYLSRIAAGELRATANLGDAPEHWPSATRTDEAWRLDGSVPALLDGGSAELLLIIAHCGHSAGVFAVQAADVARAALPVWDLTRRYARIDLAGLSLPAEARIDDAQSLPAGLRRATALAGLWLAAEQLGGAQQCLDLTLAYAAQRKQFGRVIAGFQAVKHRCAEMMVRIESTRSMVYGAAAHAADAADPQALLADCMAAKAVASDSYFYCAQEAIQLHGGVGFTWEYDPQLHFKRAQAGARWLGAPDALRASIADALFDGSLAA